MRERSSVGATYFWLVFNEKAARPKNAMIGTTVIMSDLNTNDLPRCPTGGNGIVGNPSGSTAYGTHGAMDGLCT
ncbi:hypothetical protein JCM12141A_46760 [Mycolicibacterium hodleri]